MSDKTETRRKLLMAALKRFAQKGYAATSVRDIITAARVSRPVLYYYFKSKADLYRALVTWAAEERLRLMREAASRATTLPGQLKELCATVFEFVQANRELMRVAFASALAAPGEVPREADCFEKGWQSFEFLRELLEKGRKSGELDSHYDSRELAMGFAGLMHMHVLLYLVRPEIMRLDRSTAETIVNLFLSGAASKPAGKSLKVKSKGNHQQPGLKLKPEFNQ